MPQSLHETLRRRARKFGASIRSLIIRAIEQAYTDSGGGHYVTGALFDGPRKPGPVFPKDESPHDLVSPDLNAPPGITLCHSPERRDGSTFFIRSSASLKTLCTSLK